MSSNVQKSESTGDDLDVARDVLRQEATALMQLADTLDADFSAAVDAVLLAPGRVICVGIGKSGHVARKIAATLSSTGTPAYYLHPAEASHGDLGAVAQGDIVLALSRSGETAELHDVVAYAKRFAASLIAITAAPESALGRAADIVLAVPNLPEACAETNAPTTSTTLMIALGDALAVALLRRRGFGADDFKMVHPGGKLGAMLATVRDIMHGGEATPVAKSGTPLNAALRELSAKGLGCIGVVDSGHKLVGVVTDGDVRRMIIAGKDASLIDNIMTPSPVTIEADAFAAAALRLMNERKITQIFVVENGTPAGVVHMHDLLRAGIA